MTLTEAEELELLELEEAEAAARGTAPAAAQGGAGAPRASQADVRAAEPPHALAAQGAAERGFDAAMQAWLKTPAGRPYSTYPYNADPMQVRAEFSRRTGRPDPQADRARAKVEHARETGEVVYEDSPGYKATKPLASMAGFALYGPAGATAAEAGVRYLALTENLDRAVKAGAISEERAAQILSNEMWKGTAVDAAWNVGTPLAVDAVGWLLKKVPGATWLKTKLNNAMGKQDLRPEKLAERADLAKTAAGKQAVKEIGKRTEGIVPTPGQVTGEAGFGEVAARTAHPKVFLRQEQQIDDAVSGMRNELLYPAAQPRRKTIGERVVSVAEDTARKVKERLRPVFQEADQVGVAVDMSDVAKVADEALKKDAAVLGKGKLTPAERAHLESIVKGAEDRPTRSAESALDFISVQKEKLRNLNQDGVPSKYFETVVGRLTESADNAFSQAQRQVGRGDLVRKLELARRDYRQMNETIFDDAMKAALKKEGMGAPEDIGQYLWQNGKVSRIEQLDDLLKLGVKEKSIGTAAADKMRRDVTRGFLQEAVKNVDDAATFSRRLNEQPRLKDTWDVLTATPAGKQLRTAMEVLEEAAKIARNNNNVLADTLGVGAIPVARAARGFLQEAVKNVDDAATFSRRLAEQPRLKDTWDTLTATPAGKQLRDAMEVLEEAAKIARNNNNVLADTLGVGAIPVARAARGGLGVSYVTGVLHPGMAVAGLSIDATTRLMATAYTQGNKGVLNAVVKTLRLRSTGTAAATKALQASLGDIEKFAAENGITDIFVGAAEGAAQGYDDMQQTIGVK